MPNVVGVKSVSINALNKYAKSVVGVEYANMEKSGPPVKTVMVAVCVNINDLENFVDNVEEVKFVNIKLRAMNVKHVVEMHFVNITN